MSQSIQALTRDRVGKGAARSLRRQERIPVVLYGGGRPNRHLSVNRREMLKIMELEGASLRTSRQNMVIDQRGRAAVLLREVQRDPISGMPIHIDFMRFDPNQVVSVSVPVHLLNREESPGVKRGGVAQAVRKELEIHCRAGDIPDVIEVSLTGMEIGDSIHIEDMTLPKGVEVRTDVNFTVAAVVGVKTEEMEMAEAEAKAAAALEESDAEKDDLQNEDETS